MVKGIVRCADNLGRVVIPREMYKTLGVVNGDPLDIYLEGNKICIVPVKLQCVICECTDESKLIEVKGVHICKECKES